MLRKAVLTIWFQSNIGFPTTICQKEWTNRPRNPNVHWNKLKWKFNSLLTEIVLHLRLCFLATWNRQALRRFRLLGVFSLQFGCRRRALVESKMSTLSSRSLTLRLETSKRIINQNLIQNMRLHFVFITITLLVISNVR